MDVVRSPARSVETDRRQLAACPVAPLNASSSTKMMINRAEDLIVGASVSMNEQIQ